MTNGFFEHIYCHPQISTADLEKISSAHKAVSFKRGDVFLQAGKVANEYYLIVEGVCRSYVHDFNGNEITTSFHCENELMIEVSSLFQRIPSQENLVAITDGTAWKIEFDVFQQLFHSIEGFREWGRAWMSNQLFLAKLRSIEMITKSAGERYLALLKEKPEVIKHAPLKQIASYLGVTDTSLSRIRKQTL